MRVTLVGAGPGDAGLLTVKGAKRLSQADVVLYDRFVSPEILALVPPEAEMINVGKQAGNHPVPQPEINRLLLDRALQGANVVRLKGGDPFVFGRGGEELELLVEQGVPFEVVPGVTSAIGGVAYAGIPVTHRDFTSSLHIITGHAKNDSEPDINYRALVETGGTLVFLMSVASLGDICAGCLDAGIDPETPAAIIENATLASQRSFVATVAQLPQVAEQYSVVSPALIVIGRVCQLGERFDWFSQLPLHGRRIAVARTRGGASDLTERLRESGAEVVELSGASYLALTGPGSALEQAVSDLQRYSWLVFTSSRGVQVFFDYLVSSDRDIRELAGVSIACVGSETARAIRDRGLKVDCQPQQFNSRALATSLLEQIQPGQRVLIARAAEGSSELPEALYENGIDYTDAAIYQTKLAETKVNMDGIDLAAFTSSAAVHWFAASAEGDLTGLRAVCIGPETAQTAREYGMAVSSSEAATITAMVTKIEELCTNGSH